MVPILMISAQIGTLGLIKIKIFWDKGYEVIISVYDVTNKILSRDSNYVVDVIMWPGFGSSNIFMEFALWYAWVFHTMTNKINEPKKSIAISLILSIKTN